MVRCLRCERDFLYPRDKRQHVANSPRHHVCFSCTGKPDFDSKQGLDEHLELEHNFCVACDRSFQSPSNLKNHLKTHAEKTVECPGCDNKAFISESAMLLHLEAGSCVSGVDGRRVVDIAFDCHQSDRYTYDGTSFTFECPTCNMPFTFMSGLFQHVESDACDEDVQGKPLRQFLNFLRSRI